MDHPLRGIQLGAVQVGQDDGDTVASLALLFKLIAAKSQEGESL